MFSLLSYLQEARMPYLHSKLIRNFQFTKILFALYVSFTLFLNVGCNNVENPRKTTTGPKVTDTTYSVIVYPTEYNGLKGFGFDILLGKQVIIHQPYIPAVLGNISFRSEVDAKKVGKLMITKIRTNQFPPSVTKNELLELSIISHNNSNEK